MTRKIILGTIICITALLYGCSAGNETASLKSTNWQLDSLIGLRIVPEGKSATLEFGSGGKISGYGGCNKYGGLYSTVNKKGTITDYMVNHKHISFTDIYATEKACTNSQVEANFLAALQKTDSYKISGGKLMLYGAGVLLVIMFERP
jgi:heat shock protein HslJ